MSSVTFTLAPKLNTFSELVSVMTGTSLEIIMKLAVQPASGPAVELISQGSIGSECKLAGTRTWHRIPSFSLLEWSDLRIRSSEDHQQEDVWIEISDGNRLVKIIDSLISLATSLEHHQQNENISSHCEIQVEIQGMEMRLKHFPSNSSFILPVRWFDSKWAAGTISLPPASFPSASVKLLSGLDQIAAILKRLNRWRNEWCVDLLTLEVARSVENEDLWDVHFVAETSMPPHVNFKASLANCPEYRIVSAPSASRECSVSVSLSAATRALIVPLAENSRLCNAATSSALILSWIPNEALVCHVNWNAVGFGPIATTIYIPSRLR